MSKPEQAARNGILVLGMHRSGTSALAGVLSKLGVSAARTQIDGDEWNSRGYWESARINHFNERLLSDAGSAWNDWRQFDQSWAGSESASRFMTESAALIKYEFGDAKIFAAKDPRICRILPFWLQALRQVGVLPSVILPLRHPVEVALSLERRDALPLADGIMLWLRYVLDAEYQSRGLSRSVTLYDGLLLDWHSTMRKIGADLSIAWPIPLDDASAQIEKFLSTDLKHNASRPAQDVGLPDDLSSWAHGAWEAFVGLAMPAPDDAQYLAQLDQIRGAFDLYSEAAGIAWQETHGIKVRSAGERKKTGRSETSIGKLSERIQNRRRYWTNKFLLLIAPLISRDYVKRVERRLGRMEAQGKVKRNISS